MLERFYRLLFQPNVPRNRQCDFGESRKGFDRRESLRWETETTLKIKANAACFQTRPNRAETLQPCFEADEGWYIATVGDVYVELSIVDPTPRYSARIDTVF